MSNKHLYAVILAGGSGTRFWPVSRVKKPKQFLEIISGQTLLELTIKRISAQVAPSRIYVVTNRQYDRVTKDHLKKFGVPTKNILLEPIARNTAPAICWASATIHKRDPQAVTIVLPSDHLILNQKKFTQTVHEAVKLADQEFLVTFGIVPHRPETGYGYLKTRKRSINGKRIVMVDKFTEKPSLAKARAFIQNKNYFWNSGMFVWKTAVILEEFGKNLPDIRKAFIPMPHGKKFETVFKGLQSISVDYGILEKSCKVAAVAAEELGWSDLGSWESLHEVLERDKNENLFLGDVIDLQSNNCLVYGGKKTIAIVGLNDCMVVDTPQALLVCKKDQSQKVKDIVEILKKKNAALL